VPTGFSGIRLRLVWRRQADARVGYREVLGQVLAIWRCDPADAFALGRELLKQTTRKRVQVSQVHHRFPERRTRREEIPSIHTMASKVVPDDARLENAEIDQLLCIVNDRDQNARRLLLSQVARLSQNNSPDSSGYGLRSTSDVWARIIPEHDGTLIKEVALGHCIIRWRRLVDQAHGSSSNPSRPGNRSRTSWLSAGCVPPHLGRSNGAATPASCKK
jgi:hypothetical protein